MSTRKTVGERIAKSWGILHFGQKRLLAAEIDRAIRHAQAKAWEDGCSAGSAEYLTIEDVPRNPYRGRVRR